MLPLDTTSDPAPDGYSDVIDVRSPGEYEEDHIPGSINLPVLNDEERHRVGCQYKESKFDGRKLGAGLVSANIAVHLEGFLRNKERDYRPLIYCFRGGQRSRSLAHVMRQVGWAPTLLVGGYKTFRSRVIEDLRALPPQFTFRTLAGLTGTAKTAILHRMMSMGVQVMDLEGLAHHRGSLLGSDPNEAQPKQKRFESRLWELLRRFDADKDVWLESESNRIGDCLCPPVLWREIKTAPRVEVRAPLGERTDFLIREYSHFIEDPELLKSRLAPLEFRHGKEDIEAWSKLIDERDWREFVSSLLVKHYDPSYTKSLKASKGVLGRHYDLPDLQESTLVNMARELSGLEKC